MIVVKHYLWLNAIMSKATRLPQLKQFKVLPFLPLSFPHLGLYPLLLTSIPFLSYLGPLPLPLLFLCLEPYSLHILVSGMKAFFLGFSARSRSS